MLLKIGVNFDPHEDLLEALDITQIECNNLGVIFIITSMRDREHSSGSKHYVGKAFDMRIKHMEENERTILFTLLKERLERKYDVLRYDTHIHIEVK